MSGLSSFRFHPSRKHSEERKNLQLSGLDDDSHKNISTTLINQETSTHDLNAKVADSFNKIIKIEDAPATEKECGSTPKPNLSHKKSFLTAANLTESSSSGSVTDSVCTAYESNQGKAFRLIFFFIFVSFSISFYF